MLHGVLIVSLNIDHKERLCLAQISNTLLKDYSYNEIHNRRVALGITCVQCTPVQLEILRRAGAMPVSSRRCGMITKREAERLVKSFLEDTEPPKLPDDFAFQVYHECGWGCHGYFEPARYNSSRAKCIKCGFCSVYFSPNKFIFHFHRTADAKYHHPDAANFNSWRRHLKLVKGPGSDDQMHVWEDVKAMFNGGTRKKIFSTSPRTSSSLNRGGESSASSSSAEAKKKTPKMGHSESLQVAPKHPFPTHTFNPYTWGYGPGAKPSYPFVSVNTSQSLCFGFPPPGGAKDNPVPRDNPMLKGGMTSLPAPWLGRSALPFSNLDAFWDKAFGLPRPIGTGGGGGGGGGYRGLYPPPMVKSPGGVGDVGGRGGHLGEGLSDEGGRMEEDGGDRKGERRECSSLDLSRDPHSSHPTGHTGGVHHTDRLSAFRPVGRNNSQAMDDDQASVAESDVIDADETEEIDVMEEEEDCSSPQDLSQPELREAQNNNNDITEERVEEKEGKKEEDIGEEEKERDDHQSPDCDEPTVKRRRLSEDDVTEESNHDVIDYSNADTEQTQEKQHEEDREAEPENDDRAPTGADDSGLSDESDADGETEDSNFLTMTKEQLFQNLKRELCNRKKKEKEVTVLRETFQEEVTREKAFRDQMARQLEVLRETLTNELEQERKVRFSLQQKLKEAHDALHSFSCSMLTAARDGCGFKDTPLASSSTTSQLLRH
ncbi:SKI family transcriptional corepressor 1-like [Littorina saxatilis]